MKKEFKIQLTTALLSCPIVYIPHFHYEMLDATLISILSPNKGHRTVDLDVNDQVIEYDGGQNIVVNFKDKRLNDDLASYADAVTLMKDFVTGRLGDGILLLKNFAEQIQERDVQSLLARYANALRKLASLCPTYCPIKRLMSSLSSDTPNSLAMDFAIMLFPQPGIPIINTPLGKAT